MSTLERRKQEKLRRRQDILDAARGLFWKQGYSGTTMPDIASDVGLAPGTLYLYFPSKTALYAELLIEGYDVLIGKLRQQDGRGGSHRERAAVLIDTFLQFAQDYPEYFNIIFFVLQREGRGGRDVLQPEQIARLEAREAACKAVAAEVLERAGVMRDGGELQDTVDAVWSMLVGVVFFFAKDGPEALAKVSGEARELVLDALFGRQAEG
jgi:AcrR family transcriptional regulator